MSESHNFANFLMRGFFLSFLGMIGVNFVLVAEVLVGFL